MEEGQAEHQVQNSSSLQSSRGHGGAICPAANRHLVKQISMCNHGEAHSASVAVA